MADARGLTRLGIHTTFFILYLLLIAETPEIVKGRYFKGYGFGIGLRSRPQNVYRPERPAGAKLSLRGSNLTSVTRQFPRVHMPRIRWTKHGHQCLWLPNVLLYHDIEFNPGPTERRPKCVTCNMAVRRNQAAIMCSNCASSGAPNGNFRENICSDDDLRSRIFGAFVVKFLACLPLLEFSNIYKMV